QARRGGPPVRIEGPTRRNDFLKDAEAPHQGALFIAQPVDGGEVAQRRQVAWRGRRTAHADRARHHALTGRRDRPPPAVRLASLSHTISGVPPGRETATARRSFLPRRKNVDFKLILRRRLRAFGLTAGYDRLRSALPLSVSG